MTIGVTGVSSSYDLQYTQGYCIELPYIWRHAWANTRRHSMHDCRLAGVTCAVSLMMKESVSTLRTNARASTVRGGVL